MADSSYQIKMNQESAQALTDVLAREMRNRPVMEKRPMTQRRRVGAVGDSVTRRFVLQTEWERQDSDQSYWATAFPVMEDAKRHIEFGHGAPVRIVYPDVNSNLPGSHKGDQVYAGFRNGRWELINFEIDTSVKAKEQFPVLYYERMVEEPLTEEELAENPEAEPKQVKQSWLICPGGNTDSGPTSVIHAFHIEKRKWSTSEFGELPFTMANFGATIVPLTRSVEVETEPGSGEFEMKDVTEQILVTASADASGSSRANSSSIRVTEKSTGLIWKRDYGARRNFLTRH